MCERFDYCHIYALRKFKFWFYFCEDLRERWL